MKPLSNKSFVPSTGMLGGGGNPSETTAQVDYDLMLCS